MQHNVMIYRDEVTAAGEMTIALKKSFPEPKFKYSRVDISDLRNGILDLDSLVHPHHFFVRPGIRGDFSKYHQDFTVAVMESYKRFLYNGGVSLESCAGAAAASRLCKYVAPWGTYRRKLSLSPIFEGYANGPLWSYARQPQEAHIESTLPEIVNTSVAPVLFKNDDGTWEQAHICYGNGPSLVADNPLDPNMEILALYNTIPRQPAALIRLQFGLGAAYLCSAHPEIAAKDHNISSKHPRLKALNEALKPHEIGRQKLWGMLTARIKNDLG